MELSRRRMLVGAVGSAALAPFAVNPLGHSALAQGMTKSPYTPVLGPRSRVLVVNDLAGDIDGLFATVHALLSPSVEIRGIVGTGTQISDETPQRSVELANTILELMNLKGRVPVHAGGTKLTARAHPNRSPGAQAILSEALRTDTELPLYVTVGGGLTDVASALLLEPSIANKMTLVWIGGGPYSAGSKGDTNFNLDPIAAQVVFNESAVPLWQVPGDAVEECQVSATELQVRVAPCGAIGAWLYQQLIDTSRKYGKAYKLNTGESWTLGDSPLVLLTALTKWGPSAYARPFRYETTGSRFDEPFAPRLRSDGTYEPRSDGRRIRVFKTVDTRLMFGDFWRLCTLHTHGNHLDRLHKRSAYHVGSFIPPLPRRSQGFRFP